MNKRLKILYLSDDYEPIYGGVSSVVKNSALALSELADVTIGTVIPPKKIRGKINDPKELRVFRCAGKYSRLTTNMSANLHDKNFKDLILKENFDIIHCHFPLKLYGFALKLKKKYKIPVVITAHSIFYPDFKAVIKSDLLTKFAIRYILKKYNKSDKTFCVTPFEKKFLSGFGLKNCVVLNNAVNMEGFEPIDHDFLDSLKHNYKIEKDDFVIASICRLAPMKNIPFSVYAFAELHKKFPNSKYFIVGDGAQKNYISSIIKKLNLQDCCFLLGAITDKHKLGAIYSLVDAISFMSKGDSCGLIQYEAAYFGKPTIALYDTAIADSIVDSQNGVIIVGDQNSMHISKRIDQRATKNYVQRVGQLVSDRNLCKLLGENAREQIYRSYDSEYAKDLLSKYKEIIQQCQKSPNIDI